MASGLETAFVKRSAALTGDTETDDTVTAIAANTENDITARCMAQLCPEEPNQKRKPVFPPIPFAAARGEMDQLLISSDEAARKINADPPSPEPVLWITLQPDAIDYRRMHRPGKAGE